MLQARLALLLASAMGRAYWPEVFSPGSPLLQSAALLGSGLLLAAFIAAMGKRRGRQARRGFRTHIWLALVGFALVAFHSTGALLKAPALMLLALIALALLGVWARTRGAYEMATTFGSKRRAFETGSADLKARLSELISQKQALLPVLEAGADEALFSLQTRTLAASAAQGIPVSSAGRAGT